MKRKGFSLRLGIREYNEILDLQKRMNSARKQNAIPDTVIFLEHYPCITIGAQGNYDSITVSRQLLKKQGINVYETDRGGDVTYHGQGQIVCYPIIDLNNYGCDVTTYARNLEEVIIRTLHSFGISSSRKKGYPGVWVDGKRKIAAQGISVDRWVTMHGVSLNVSPAMEHFTFIIPCGLKGYEVVSMEEYLGQAVDVSKVLSEMIRQFSRLFDIELEEIGEDKIVELLDHEQDQSS
jgi:lipoyl(octanoyl) transferase